MNKTLLIKLIAVSILFLIGCKNNNKQPQIEENDSINGVVEISSSKEIIETHDSIYISLDSCIILINLTEDRIREMKKQYTKTEDFYVVMDDYSSYKYEAVRYINSINMPIIQLKEDKIINLANSSYFNSKQFSIWDVLFYKKGDNVKICNIVDINLNIYNPIIHVDDNNMDNEDIIGDEVTIQDCVGIWKIDCESASWLKIDLNNTVYALSPNQIYVEVELKETENNEYNIFLIKPDKLGQGGFRLDWDEFSKDSIIATIKFSDEKKSIFQWFGFYNMKTKVRDFTESEFNREAENEIINLIKCDSL